jgi:hypothetical protein
LQSHQSWSEEDVGTLWRMYKAGAPNSDIIVALGRSRAAVVGKLSWLRRRGLL